jgi:glycosidase
VPKSEWQKLADDKIDMVWLMGVWQLGTYGPELDKTNINNFRNELPDVQPDDIIGSPYAVKNYTVNSDIGTPADLAQVRGTLKELGMKLMLDFVPNHGAVDSDFAPDVFISRPSSGSFPANWWKQRGSNTLAYGRGPYDGPWTDTLQYNYWNQKTVSAMTEVLISIASQADAIRCDMAMLILNDVIQRTWQGVMQANGFGRPSSEFWASAIDAVRKQYPETIFMAEAYDYDFTNPPEKQLLQNLGFDFVYDKTVLDDLVSNNLDKIRGYIGSQSQSFFERTAHFVENHDEQRSAKALGGQQQAFAGAVVAATIPGLRLFYFGQFDGFSAKLDVQLRRATTQPSNEMIRKQYSALLHVLAHDVFHSGAWTFIQTSKEGSSWRLAAWRWRSLDGAVKRVVVVNFSGEKGWANIRLDDVEGSGTISMTELLTGIVYDRNVNELKSNGLVCGLDPWTAQIFSYDRPQKTSEHRVVV